MVILDMPCKFVCMSMSIFMKLALWHTNSITTLLYLLETPLLTIHIYLRVYMYMYNVCLLCVYIGVEQ